ncbi:MAG: hypothetical protein QQN63_07245 [Nitrosopumilus sp.]
MATSKASNETDYVDLQIRQDNGDTFKVQGSGTPANREYGVADVVTVNPGFGIGNYVKALEATVKSLAGGTSTYLPVQAAIRQNLIHFQITSSTPFSVDDPNELSRDYGAIFNIPVTEAPALADFVHNNATGGSGEEFLGTDDDDEDDKWSDEPSTYAPDDSKSGACGCNTCLSDVQSDGTPKTVVINGVTYNLTPTK